MTEITDKIIKVVELAKNVPGKIFYILFWVMIVILILGLLISSAMFLPNETTDIFGFNQVKECLYGFHGATAFICAISLIAIILYKLREWLLLKDMVANLSKNELNMLNKFRIYSENVLCLGSNEFICSLESKGIIFVIAEENKSEGRIFHHLHNRYKKAVYERLEIDPDFKDIKM